MIKKNVILNTVTPKALTVFLAPLIFLASAAPADSILLVGDSHTCGSFGKTLETSLTGLGHQVDVFCTPSSSATHWLLGKSPKGYQCHHWTSHQPSALCRGDGNTPAAHRILDKRYDLSIIALGTNFLDFVTTFSGEYLRDMDALNFNMSVSFDSDESHRRLSEVVRQNSESCVWVGPPHLRPDQAKGFSGDRLRRLESNLDGFYVFLFDAARSSCQIFDSRTVTQSTQPAGQTVDGVHRTTAAGAAWAKEVFQFIERAVP